MFERATAIGDVYEMIIKQEMNNQIYMNTFHWVIDTRAGTPFVIAIYNALVAAATDAGGIVDKLAAIWPGQNVAKQVSVQRINSSLTPARLGALRVAINEPGTRPNGNTGNMAAVIERRADPASRRSVGTLHIVLPNDVTAINLGKITPAIDTDMSLLSAVLAADIDVGPGEAILKPCLYHKTVPYTFSLITQYINMNTVRVMRRRTVGQGI